MIKLLCDLCGVETTNRHPGICGVVEKQMFFGDELHGNERQLRLNFSVSMVGMASQDSLILCVNCLVSLKDRMPL